MEKEAVPSGFRVLSVDVIDSLRSRLAYALAKVDVQNSTADKEAYRYTPWTSRWATGLSACCNEWMLLHGTSPASANAIKEHGFSIDRAKPTGICGPFLYFGESSTKADEYTSAAPGGGRQLVVCRVLGGDVLYTEDAKPDKDALASAVRQGTHHSVLNNREATRGTYKEFAVLDPTQVLPECVVHYDRLW